MAHPIVSLGLVTAIRSAQQLLNTHLPFSDSSDSEQKTLHMALHHCEKLLFIKSFGSYLATSLTEIDMRFCRVDPHVEVDG